MSTERWTPAEVQGLRGEAKGLIAQGEQDVVAIANKAVAIYRKKVLESGALSPDRLSHLLGDVDGWSSHFGNMIRGHLEPLGFQLEVARSIRISQDLEAVYQERDAALAALESLERRLHGLLSAAAVLHARITEVEVERDGWWALALRLLVVGTMVRAQWERYALAAGEAIPGGETFAATPASTEAVRPDPGDTWHAFECSNCGCCCDARAPRKSPLSMRRPRCGEAMTLAGTWRADASGYGSRVDGDGQRERIAATRERVSQTLGDAESARNRLNCPGHSHRHPGLWDGTGEVCERCTAWAELWALLDAL